MAAGYSQRYGDTKLLAALDNGNTVFEQTLSQIRSAIDEVLVVTRPELAEELGKQCPDLLVFTDAQQGMGSTLAFAVRQITNWDCALICLADMPFLSDKVYKIIAAKGDPDTIVIPTYQGNRANPVCFGKRFFPELGNLSGDTGGRTIIKQYSDAVNTLEINDSAVIDDIDTPQDLERLQS